MYDMFSDLVPGETKIAAALASNDYGIRPGTTYGIGNPGVYPNPNPPPVLLPASPTAPVYTAPVVSKTPATPAPVVAPVAAPPSSTSTPSALSGWDAFYNSPTYQVPLAEGLEGVNTKYAAMGALESGAAMKAINDYAAGHAASALSTYMDDLYRQEALGAQAASSLAGVGTSMVGQVSSNNQSAADAAGNAQLWAGQATANNWNTAGQAINTGASAIAGALNSSYRGMPSGSPFGSSFNQSFGSGWDGNVMSPIS